jgi:hypothetical protein
MATNIVGTLPILNSKKSQTDEYGFDYITYQYTATTAQLASLLPKKDDKFYGITPNTFSAESNYVVTDTETNLANGGLAQFVIQTTGTRNAINANAPKITLIPNSGPLIFGIGTTSPNLFFKADGSVGIAGRGITIQLEFLGEGGTEAEAQTIQTYLFSVIPTTFRNTAMPITKRAGSFSIARARPPLSFLSSQTFIGISGFYYGYVCTSVRTERRGGLALYTLIFQEAGFANEINDSSSVLNPEGATTTQLYNFAFTN